MNIFDIIGPIMIGPSSSHTAGAVRLGRVAGQILGVPAAKARIGLAGSFARTYKGHGTDKALVAGILGMRPDDERIRNSLDIAREQGLDFQFHEVRLPRVHPNTVVIHLTAGDGGECTLQGASIGGGNIVVTGVNGVDTAFSGERDTIIVPHKDVPGAIATVTALVADSGANIGNFRLHRPEKGYQAVMTIEVDGKVAAGLLDDIRRQPGIVSVAYIPANV